MSTSETALVGGEFELRVEDLALDGRRANELPRFGAPFESWFDTGRSALAVAARDILQRGGQSTVWLPAYVCDAVVAPFRQQGFAIRYYGVGPDLVAVDAAPAPGDTLLFIHYFGHRNRGALARVGQWRAASVRVIEDCAQAGLTEGVGTHGDYAVSSLRKLLPVPDGALLASRLPVASEAGASDEEFISAKIAGKLLRGARGPAEIYLRLFEHAECRLDAASPRHLSWLSGQLLRNADLGLAAARRRRNWSSLRAALAGSPKLRGLSPLFHELDPGDVPLGFPVRVGHGQRDALRRHLASREIYCAVHWALDHVPGEFENERGLSGSLLTLPSDQRYDSADMERLVEALQSFPGDLR